MLKNSYVHIPKIGISTEIKLWENDILSWDDFLNNGPRVIPPEKIETIRHHLLLSKKALEENNLNFFETIPKTEHWRLFPYSKTCYLDIETTGLSPSRNKVTVVGISDGKKGQVFIRGKDFEKIKQALEGYDMIVTFNGASFDIPFLAHNMPELKFPKYHVDLRHFLRKLGYSGGLKRIEKEFGINRAEEVAEVDGYEAVRLWKKYERGCEESLKTLIQYNLEDVENLKILMERGYKEMREKVFLSVV